MITKPTFGSCSDLSIWKSGILIVCSVGPDFTRRPVKYERFIRPMGLRYKKAHVTNPELKGELQNLQGANSPFRFLFTRRGPLDFRFCSSESGC